MSTGYGFTGSLVVAAAGGSLMGSANQVGVERVGTAGVPLYADVTGLPSSPGMPAAYVARVSAANAYLQALVPVTANVAAFPKVFTSCPSTPAHPPLHTYITLPSATDPHSRILICMQLLILPFTPATPSTLTLSPSLCLRGPPL